MACLLAQLSVFSRVWSDPTASELAQIPTGQLYLVRPNSIKGSRECIFNDAMITVRRTATEFHFHLVVTKVYADGDEPTLEEDDECEDEKVFLLDEAIRFRSSTFESTPSFQWADIDGDEGDFFEFVAIGTNAPTAGFFETSALKAIYERKHLRSSESASEFELAAMAYKPPPPRPVRKQSTPKANKVAEAAPAAAPPESPTPVKTKPKPQAKAPPPEAESQSSQVSERPTVVDEEAQLYLWESEPAEQFALQANIRASIVENDEYDYYMVAVEGDTYWLAHPISSDLNGRWSKALLSFTWSHLSKEGVASSWCFLCVGDVTQTTVGKAKADEQQYAIDSYSYDQDVEMENASDEEDDVEDVLSTVDEEESGDEDDSEDEHAARMPDAGGKNKLLANGYKNGLSYIARGKNIGVFRKTEDDQLEYAATISKVLTPQGKQFAPKKMMLHQQDATLVLMNEQNPNSLYQMDIETGKVVEEWKISDHMEINSMAPDSKFAQMTPGQTLVGTSHNALFRIDPRVSGNKLVDSEYKQYATKAAFSSVATTDKGGLAVASEKGDIRLFDTIGKNAKTALPALGDPVIGVDVTADGRYVVATCRTYLLLIDTLIGEGRYAGSLGFDRSFPADAKPMPKRLQLRPEHVGYMGGQVSFTPARFNSGPEAEEQYIVTSTGNFVIAWDFRKVKKGRLDRYDIKQYEQQVMADDFRMGDNKDIVVALSDNVHLTKKQALVKPTRQSLAGPSVRSRSDIVNAPY
ncbi:vacuolar import and degradation protein 27 [Ceratobasidium sp. AG-Ba]|nr:vacuolar import and degradation protein 27 [Ceratobasidium sp. AG-Ba]